MGLSPDLRWQASAPARAGDPYLDWSLATGWAGQPPNRSPLWVPLLAPRGAAWDAVLARLAPQQQAFASPWNPPDTAWGVLWVRAEQAGEASQALPGSEMSQPQALPGPPAVPVRRPRRARRSPAVVIAAIDRGGAVLNDCFGHRDRPERTRLIGFWDQAEGPMHDPWLAPSAGYGRELDGPRIDALRQRARHDPQGELGVYRDLGLHDLLLAHALGEPDHATHVLDTLAGLPDRRPRAASAKPTDDDAAAGAPLVLVSVPPSRIGQTTGTATVAQVLDGLHYVLALADAHAPHAPVVVNISLGLLAGPHDGSSALERAIDDLMRRRPRLLVVLAAGNNGGDRLIDPSKGTNAGGRLAPGAEATLTWRLQPGDPTDSFLELWAQGAEGAAPDLRLRVIAPVPSCEVGLNRQSDLRCGDDLAARLHCQALDAGHRVRAQLSLAPVAGPRGLLPAGAWVLGLRNAGTQPLALEARVQGDLPRWTDSEPVQSVLAGATGLHLGGAGSLNGLATGRCPVVVGAVRASDGRDALYTAQPKAPDAAVVTGPCGTIDARATADEGVFAPGLVASGVASGSWVRMGGTSVAAPVAARHAASRLAQGQRPRDPDSWGDFLRSPDGQAWRP